MSNHLAGMYACIGTPRSCHVGWLAQQKGNSALELCLHGISIRLYLPAMIAGAVIAEPDEVSFHYSVVRSSQPTIPYMTPMEMRHTIRNTVQQSHIGQALYMTGPIQMSRLPAAVAPSHNP